MPDAAPILLWFRRDLRLADHPALTAAVETGRPIIPVFINDEVVAGQGAAPRFRLGLSVGSLAQQLESKGSKLILRLGDALQVLRNLIAETGATSVYWSRAYDPITKDRDKALKAALKDDGITAQSFTGHLLFEPWTVETKTGGFYRVYTPMWRAVRNRDVPAPVPAPSKILAPTAWPASDNLGDWQLDKAMNRGAAVLGPHCTVGEAAANDRLGAFIEDRVASYADQRDFPAVNGTSGLSENLTCGEISPATCWHAGWSSFRRGADQAEIFLKELVWREFAYHLAFHTPHITTANWRPEWDAFPWNTDESTAEVTAWKQGRTGIPFVDAAMRQMYVTGVMHNRARMIVASYLTKNLMSRWQIGERWFADCLIDWDPASNAMGWQWVAGSGPDAAPYFRVFNPVTQLEKFDRDGRYQKQWITEGFGQPTETALSYFDAIPRSWGLSPDDRYPSPIVTPEEGRMRALDAYAAREKPAN
ncbi:cryptochrome/photolyase family protein [Cognatiyoonia sp.]|uniref:cryptochrome/photolyase family protein n=1 Tax=Cognatiyoonia sp. TaxID=2211652 RepID=UPI003F696399